MIVLPRARVYIPPDATDHRIEMQLVRSRHCAPEKQIMEPIHHLGADVGVGSG